MKASLFLRDIRGQERALALLAKNAASGRLPHAFLFRGPRGVGKRSTAMAFARFLLCREPADNDACGRCPACHRFAAATHPDIQTVAPRTAAIKIEQIREMQRSLAFPPLEGSLRVTVIIRAQTMAAPAANALLKTLEEPPEGNLLILTAEENEPILPTIVSRCQVVPFASLDDRAVREIIQAGAEEEEPGSASLARLAAGSPGLAAKLGNSRMTGLLEEVTGAIARQEGTGRMIALAGECAKLKDDLPLFLQGLYAWAADLAWHACGLGERAALLSEAEQALAARLGAKGAADALAGIGRARSLLARNCNRQAVCELLFLPLAAGGRAQGC